MKYRARIFVSSLVFVLGVNAALAQEPPSEEWEVRGTVEFQFDRSVSADQIGERTVQVFHRDRQVAGGLSFDARTSTAVFHPSIPFDTRYPFTWELDPALGSHFLASDWIAAAPPCPFPKGTDTDEDGLPDCSERPGTYYQGVPIYAYGARLYQKDIFIEVDYMIDPERPWITPRWEALERVRRAFLDHRYVVHFDAGDLFGGAYLDTERFNLGGGNEVPLASSVPWAVPKPNCENGWDAFPQDNFLTDYRQQFFNAKRDRSFYYILFAAQVNSDKGSGRTLHAGSNSIVTFGYSGWGDVFTAHVADNDDDPLDLEEKNNQIINYQAGTLMHEFGHQLGLREGGDELETWKPNYISVMSYYYQTWGLPGIGVNEGDRYLVNQACGLTKAGLDHGPYIHWEDFPIDYSDGTSLPLDENTLDESLGLGRPGSAWVDWNCNGVLDAQPIKRNINHDQWDPNQNKYVVTYKVLTDHDDWSNIVLYHRKWYTSGQPWPEAGLPFVCEFP
jgi:hypothetical protein